MARLRRLPSGCDELGDGSVLQKDTYDCRKQVVGNTCRNGDRSCLFYLKSASRFDEQLPAETQAEIADLENGKIKNFPQYFTLLNNAQGLSLGTVASNTVGITDIGVEEANLLASQTKWVTEQHMDELTSMFASVAPPTSSPTLPPTKAPTNAVQGFWHNFKRF